MENRNKTYRRVLLIVNLLLLAALFCSVAGFYSVLQSDAVAGPVSGDSPGEAYRSAHTSSVDGVFVADPSEGDYKVLASSGLFAALSDDEVEDNGGDVSNDEYTLPEMRLVGTIAGEASLARAMIGMRNGTGDQRLYRIGDIVGGARLETIKPGSVVFARGGQLYRVDMDRSGEVSQAPARDGRRATGQTGGALIVGLGGAVTVLEEESVGAPRAEDVRRGRWSEMDDDERARRLEEMRERRERMLEDADPEVRERMLERMREAEEGTRQRRDRTRD